MSPLKSGVKHSTKMKGFSSLILLTVFAKWLDPPSSRSSLSTLVSTTYPTPHCAMALAVFSTSSASTAGGACDVLTAQNLHPRVHVSPKSITVAVATCLDFPSALVDDQHSPMFGHCA